MCRETKPISDFYMQSNNPDHHAYGRPQGRCKACVRSQVSSYRRDNPDKAARAVRNSQMKADFGISLADFETMLSNQGGVCAICGERPKRRRLAVDHCHQTGRVRGLLCYSCNVGIGALRDSPDVIRSAIAYLRRER